MKYTKLIVLTLGAALFIPMATRAQVQAQKFYVKGDVGGNWTSDTDLEEFFGPVRPGSKVSFDPGIRLGIAAGYQVTDWFAAELELGFTENSVKSITDAWVADATMGVVPLLVNVKFQLPNNTRFTPYIGAGVGGAAVYMNIDDLHIGNTSVWGTESAAVFAYQGFAGVRFAINDRMGLSVEYRYFGADGPDFEADFIYYYGGSDNFRLGRLETQSVSLAFDWRF